MNGNETSNEKTKQNVGKMPDYRLTVFPQDGEARNVGAAWNAKGQRSGVDYLNIVINEPIPAGSYIKMFKNIPKAEVPA